MATVRISTNKARQILSNVYNLDNAATYVNKNTVSGSILNATKNGNEVEINCASGILCEYTLIERCVLPSVTGIKKCVGEMNKYCSFASVYLNLDTLRLSFYQFSNVNSYVELHSRMLPVMHFKSYKGQLTIALLKEAIVEALSEYLNR